MTEFRNDELRNFGITEFRNYEMTNYGISELRNFGITNKGKTIWHRPLRCGAIKMSQIWIIKRIVKVDKISCIRTGYSEFVNKISDFKKEKFLQTQIYQWIWHFILTTYVLCFKPTIDTKVIIKQTVCSSWRLVSQFIRLNLLIRLSERIERS